MLNNQPAEFALYWVEDNLGEDWFVLTPSYDKNNNYFELELTEEYHSSYEGIEYNYSDGNMYSECNATLICYVPTSLLEKTLVSKYDSSAREIVADIDSIDYLQASRESYIELLERINIIEDVLHNELLPDFPKELKDKILSSDNPIDYTYDFFINNFEDTEGMEALLEDVYGITDSEGDIIDIILFFLYNVKISKHLDFLITKPYGCLYAQSDLLTKIDGMSRIDQGDKSIFRAYVYNGCLYQEGSKVVRTDKE